VRGYAALFQKCRLVEKEEGKDDAEQVECKEVKGQCEQLKLIGKIEKGVFFTNCFQDVEWEVEK
jgi:hypothetical protein